MQSILFCVSWHRNGFLSSQELILTHSSLIRNFRGGRLPRIQNTALLTAVSALNELFERRQISYIYIVHFMLFTMCISLHSVL
jgi:hypothetical protein